MTAWKAMKDGITELVFFHGRVFCSSSTEAIENTTSQWCDYHRLSTHQITASYSILQHLLPNFKMLLIILVENHTMRAFLFVFCTPPPNEYRIAGIFRGVKFSWMFKFSSIRGLMFVVCDVHDHTCLKL